MFKFFKKNKKEEKQKEVVQKAVKKVEDSELKKQLVQEIVDNIACTKEEADQMLRDAKKRLGIKFKTYVKMRLYEVPVEKQREEYEKVLAEETMKKGKNMSKSEKVQLDKHHAIMDVIKATGWDYDKAQNEIEKAKKRTGCSYKEYAMYKFYELEEKVQDELFLVALSRKVREKYDVSEETANILNKKALTNKTYSEFINRPWCINTEVSFDEFNGLFKDSKKVIYKPLRGSRGNGVQSFAVDEENIRKTYDAIKSLPAGLVEEYVVQHKKLLELSPGSVNTIRIATISSNTMDITPDGKKMDVAYAALRIGGGTSIVDNFHSGGMVAAIDMETGTLITDAADMAGNVYANHPMTGVKIKGFEVPFFKEAVEMVKAAIEKNKPEGYLGWDVAITDEGPVLIEINLSPGVVLLTMPYIVEHKGMKHVMEKYL